MHTQSETVRERAVKLPINRTVLFRTKDKKRLPTTVHVDKRYDPATGEYRVECWLVRPFAKIKQEAEEQNQKRFCVPRFQIMVANKLSSPVAISSQFDQPVALLH